MSSQDGIKTKVIVTVVSSCILAVLGYITIRIWPPLEKLLFDVILLIKSIVTTNITIPLWFFTVIFLVALIPMIQFFVAARKKIPKEQTWRDFTESKYFDIVWRWLYDSENTITHIIAYCPKCDLQLTTNECYISQYHRATKFHCDECGHVTTIPDDNVEVWKKVKRRINRDIANEVWK